MPFQRFERASLPEALRDVRGLIERLLDQGRELWDEDSPEFQRWRKYCDDLSEFVVATRARRQRGVRLATIMREFFSVFEHSEIRLQQLLGQVPEDQRSDERASLYRWMPMVFQGCTRAIVACWFDYKDTEPDRIYVDVNFATGETRQRVEHTPMKVPRKDRRPPRLAARR